MAVDLSTVGMLVWMTTTPCIRIIRNLLKQLGSSISTMPSDRSAALNKMRRQEDTGCDLRIAEYGSR